MVSRRHLLKLSALGTATFAAPLAYSASNTTMTHKTGNPLGSSSLQDIDDNARSLDLLVSGDSPTYLDRRGMKRKSWAGMEGEFNAEQIARQHQFEVFLNSSGYEAPVPYAPGIEMVRITQTVSYLNNEFRAKSQYLPFTTSDWATDESKLSLIGDDSLRMDMADATDPGKGAGQVGAALFTPGAVPTTVLDVLSRTYSVLDVLTAIEYEDVRTRKGTLDINEKIQKLFDAVPDGSRILFDTGVYLNSGAVGLVVGKPLLLEFQRGAVLKFDHNDAKYLQTCSSDVTLLSPQIDGGSKSWVRTNNAGIRVRSNGAPVSNIEIIRPRIENVAGAGLLVGWSENISDVIIDSPVVRNSQADGVSVAYDTSDVSIMSPRCYNTGDDGVSVVSYIAAANPVRRVIITDALCVDSHTRGLTVIGGEDIKLTGKSINATAQGVLVIQDVGQYNTYAPKRIKLDVEAFSSEGIGIEIGRGAEDVSGSATAVGARGTRGILIGSAEGFEPKRIIMSLLAAYDCSGIGVEFGRAITLSVGVVDAVANGASGVLAVNTFNLSVGSLNAYNNNTNRLPSTDNIFYSGVMNFSIGSATSTDDRIPHLVERTFDLSMCANGVVGSFNGVLGGKTNVLPNIQVSCSNVRSSSEIVIKVGAPEVSEIPVRGFLVDVESSRLYVSINGVCKFIQLV